VLVGGRSTVEDAYAYSKFARMVLGTNDIDFRIRAHSQEEADFLASNVAGQPMTVTYADLEKAPALLLAGFEPEDESPIVFLRLRKAARENGLQVLAVAPFATRGLTKMSGTLIRTRRTRRTGAAQPARRDHPRRRAPGDLSRSPLRGNQIGRGDRCPSGLGPPPSR
jgi:NADH-quinone oxidoreductase subunit G